MDTIHENRSFYFTTYNIGISGSVAQQSREWVKCYCIRNSDGVTNQGVLLNDIYIYIYISSVV